MDVESPLMEDPAVLGTRIQGLLLMNPEKRFIVERRGDLLRITPKD